MKKIVAYLIILILACNFVACDGKNVKLALWQSDNIASISTESEINLETDFYAYNPTAEETKTITFMSEIVETEYDGSVSSPYYNSDYDRYIHIVGSYEVYYSFGINQKTGEIVKYLHFPLKRENPEGIEKLSRDECFEIALSELDKIDNGYVYTLINEKQQDIYGGIYDFVFVRMIGELKTKDEINITIGQYGEVFALQWVDQNSLLGVTEVDYNADEVNSSIHNKLKDLYDKDDVQYIIEEQIIVKLKDESVGLECTIEVENGTEFPDTIKLFVEL